MPLETHPDHHWIILYFLLGFPPNNCISIKCLGHNSILFPHKSTAEINFFHIPGFYSGLFGFLVRTPATPLLGALHLQPSAPRPRSVSCDTFQGWKRIKTVNLKVEEISFRLEATGWTSQNGAATEPDSLSRGTDVLPAWKCAFGCFLLARTLWLLRTRSAVPSSACQSRDALTETPSGSFAIVPPPPRARHSGQEGPRGTHRTTKHGLGQLRPRTSPKQSLTNFAMAA